MASKKIQDMKFGNGYTVTNHNGTATIKGTHAKMTNQYFMTIEGNEYGPSGTFEISGSESAEYYMRAFESNLHAWKYV